VTVEKAVVARLASDAGVAALVGQRVYQLIMPQKPTLPAVRVQLISDPEFYHLRGGSVAARARVQTDVFTAAASGYDAATTLAAVVDTVLSGAKFTIGSPPEIEITGAFRDNRFVAYEPDELRMIRVMQDYIVWYRT